jgi:outer membrane biosynthesis protein TonB
MNEEKLMAKKKKKKKVSLVFLLSLISHVLFILFIFLFGFKKYSNPEKKMLKLEKKDKNNLIASLRPQKSVFGTTVFFDDTPQFTPQKAKEFAKKENIIPEISSEEQEKIESSIKKEELKLKTEQKTFLAKKETLKKAVNSKEEKKEQKESKNVNVVEISKEILRNTGKAKRDAAPINQKKKILSMTKGFLDNLKDKGNDWMRIKGDDNKIATLEDLKAQGYVGSIVHSVRNEHHILFNKLSYKEKMELYKDVRQDAIFTIVVDKNGKLCHAENIKTSGSKKFDDYYLKAIKDAGNHRTIPKHLNKEHFAFNILLKHKP